MKHNKIDLMIDLTDNMNQPTTCPICNSGEKIKNTMIQIANGNIFFCNVCNGYFLFPQTIVEYKGSGWSESRKIKWRYDVQRANEFAPAIKKYYEDQWNQPLKTVLELGCSTAYMGIGFRNIGCDYSGIDLDTDSIEFAKKNEIDAHISSLEEIEKITLPYKKYDLVISSNVFEHLKDPILALKKLKPICGGIIIIIVPNADGLFHKLSALKTLRKLIQFASRDSREIVYSIDGYWHNVAYTQNTLKYFCEQVGMDCLKISQISINDPVFGFVQPNKTFFYRFISHIAAILSMDSQIILIARPKN